MNKNFIGIGNYEYLNMYKKVEVPILVYLHTRTYSILIITGVEVQLYLIRLHYVCVVLIYIQNHEFYRKLLRNI